MTALENAPAGEQSDRVCLLNSTLQLRCTLSPVQMMLSFQQHPALCFFTSFSNDGELKSTLSGLACAQPFLAGRKTEAQIIYFSQPHCSAGSIHRFEIDPKPLLPWYSKRRATALAFLAVGTFAWGSLSQMICSLSISDQPGP